MFDIYLGFAEPGDQYLGRLLAGLDPNKAEFATLPPHFVEGMENEYISEAMNLCFKGIMDKVTDDIMVVVDNDNGGGQDRQQRNRQHAESGGLRANTKALLLRCLACIVHHSDSLLEVVQKHNGAHPFASIPILIRPELLAMLKPLVTMDVSDRIRMATGIPPHVEAVKKLDELVDLVNLERDERKRHFDDIKNAVGEKIEEIAIENGTLTRPAVERLFDSFGKQFETHISAKIDSVLRSVVQPPEVTAEQVEVVQQETHLNRDSDSGKYPLFYYDGQFWQVPRGFKLPTKVKRKQGWELWLCGMTTHDAQQLRPFRLFQPKFLPKKVKTKFKTEWQPIMRKMEAGLCHIQIPSDVANIDSDFIDTTFVMSTSHLKQNVCSFLWEKEDSIIENWNISTWSSNTQRSYILKHGNDADKGNLPAATRYNVPHRNKRTCRRGRAAIYDHAEEEDEEEHNMEHIIQDLNITQQEAI